MSILSIIAWFTESKVKNFYQLTMFIVFRSSTDDFFLSFSVLTLIIRLHGRNVFSQAHLKCVTDTISHVVCGSDKYLEKTWQQNQMTQNVLISNENQTGRCCKLLWHFQGQCTQFTILSTKSWWQPPLSVTDTSPDYCYHSYSFACHQSVSWVKNLISAFGVALENVLHSSASLRTR